MEIKLLKDYPLKNSVLIKHYEVAELITYQDAMNMGYGELEIQYSYVESIGDSKIRVLIVK